ncbi:MAG: hypothetical protein HYU66_14745, partial [Armatimonadetes bacterium]|nr:hypothetical protein [Armatimonadota bacterium]
MFRRAVRLVWVLGGMLLLPACGGGGRSQGVDGGIPPVVPGGSSEVGTARVHVDVQTGEVTVSPLGGGRAVFAGSTIALHTSTLFDQPGNSGLRVLRVSLQNQSGLPLGQLPDGTVTGLRAFVGQFANLSTADLDLRDQVTVSTVAGTGVAGWLDGSALTGKLNMPWGVARDASGSLNIVEFAGQRVRLLKDGMLSTVAGAGSVGNVDGVALLAKFNNPLGIACNPTDGSLVVTDASNACIRRVTASGSVTRIAGTGTTGYVEGAGDVAKFNLPVGVAVTNT